MNESFGAFILGVGVGATILVVVHLFIRLIIIADTCKEEQQKAIEAKVGGWVISSDTGESQFVYANPTDFEEFNPEAEEEVLET